jgi:hypothetical protein
LSDLARLGGVTADGRHDSIFFRRRGELSAPWTKRISHSLRAVVSNLRTKGLGSRLEADFVLLGTKISMAAKGTAFFPEPAKALRESASMIAGVSRYRCGTGPQRHTSPPYPVRAATAGPAPARNRIGDFCGVENDVALVEIQAARCRRPGIR